MSVGSDRRADALAQACARAMWARDRASQGLGIQLEQVRAGYARATMRVTEAMLNGHDVCHGGFVFLLADTAFAFACNTGDAVTLAVGCDIVFVAPAHAGDELVAEARERVRFGRSGVYDVTVGRRGDDAVVAEFRGRSLTTDRRILPERA